MKMRMAMSKLQEFAAFVKKAQTRIYLKPGEKAPEGVKVIEGKKHGRYYFGVGNGPEESEEEKQPSAVEGEQESSPEEWAKSLTEEELGAIADWQTSDWVEMREWQVNGRGSEEVKQKLLAFNNAMNKDGKYQGVVYRGLSLEEEDFNKIANSKTIELEAHSSSSKDLKVGTQFAAFGTKTDKAVVLQIKAKSGVDIEPISVDAFKEQREVVLPKGNKYKVLGKKEMSYREIYGSGPSVRSGGIVILELEEI